MRISVVILTCNRADMLEGCLGALSRQTRPPDEIVVVDNGSTDRTPDVIARNAETLPVRRIEGVTGDRWNGAAEARNRGVREASGSWIAFTDDDCLPNPDWLNRIETHVRSHHADAIGGVVVDAGDLRFPWWWHDEMNWAPGLSVPGMWGPLAGSVYYPQTANMAVRRDVLLDEPFQELPPDRADSSSAFRATREDAELWRRLRRRGCRAFVDSDLVMRHRTERARVRLRAVLRRAWRDGMALQLRESSTVLLDWAHNDIVALPFELVFGIWRGSRAPWREVAWKIVWAVRQGGQWAQSRRARGFWPTLGRFLGLSTRWGAGRLSGAVKRIARWVLVRWHRLRRPRMKHTPPPASVIVAASGFVGDTVLLHPFLSALKAQRPEVFITLLTNAAGEQIYRHDPSIHEIVLLEGGRDARARDDAAIRYALDRSRAPLVLVPYFYNVDPTLLLKRRDVRVVTFEEEVGFPRQLHYDLADRLIPKPTGRHEGLNLLHLFREAGLQGGIPEAFAPLAFQPDELLTVRETLRVERLGIENLVILAPGSAKAEKQWPEDRWGEIVRYLVDEYDLSVVLEGPVKEHGLCTRIARVADRSAKVWCENDLRRLALWLAEARLVLCSDNGSKHLAVAMDTATLCLYGPTDERQWGAIRHPHKHGAVRGCAWDLSPEERIGLNPTHQMDCITVEAVKRALDEMLAER